MVKKSLKYFYITLILLFLYAPIILLIIYSFNLSKDIGTWSKNWGFDLYVQLIKDDDIIQTIINTLVLAVVSSALSTILGTIGAIGMYYSKKKTSKVLSGITQIPMINAEIVTAVSLALICTMLTFGRTYASLLIGHIVLSFPFVVLSITPKLKQLDPNLYEASLDLGATPLKALISVVIPEILPGIASGFMLAITLSLDDYIITTFTKPATFETISTYVFNAYAKGGNNTSVPALRALSTVIFIVIVGFVLIKYFVDSRKKENK